MHVSVPVRSRAVAACVFALALGLPVLSLAAEPDLPARTGVGVHLPGGCGASGVGSFHGRCGRADGMT